MTSQIILPGFNPDPSIVRVGEDYYIATSTFEWYPGVQIFHSRDLKSWRLMARPLNRASLLDMAGIPDSGGVWAPALSFADGRFWLAYTIVRRLDGRFKDTHNYLTSCDTIDGRWDDPIHLNSSGFDPSLFHDADGRKYLVNMMWDHRPDRTPFGGIHLQEYDAAAQRLIGPVRTITHGSPIGLTEGPHLYRRDGFYYLLTAEGGTGYHHAVTLARSRRIEGPYDYDPSGPIVTARDRPDARLQRCGHGSLVETPDGRWFMPHLCTRPLPGTRLSPLGRETALTEVAWTPDGWLRAIASDLPAPAPQTRDYRFDGALDPDFQWLRRADPSPLFSLTHAPGALTLFGREALGSLYDQALVARRQTAWAFSAEAEVDFVPASPQQMAGLVSYYNSTKYHYLYIGHDEAIGRHLGIMSCAADVTRMESFPIQDALVPLPPTCAVRMRAVSDGSSLRFSWAIGDAAWQSIGPTLDAWALSDETGSGDASNFTGSFIGVCAQDLTGQAQPATVTRFRYDETQEQRP